MKYLGVDWGLKRIGLALSEGELANPLMSVNIAGLKDGVEKIRNLVEKEGIGVIVIGQPEGEMGVLVEKAIKELSKINVEVAVGDETLSTQIAKKEMINLRKGKKARRDDNAMAAAIILQRYLDEKP